MKNIIETKMSKSIILHIIDYFEHLKDKPLNNYWNNKRIVISNNDIRVTEKIIMHFDNFKDTYSISKDVFFNRWRSVKKEIISIVNNHIILGTYNDFFN